MPGYIVTPTEQVKESFYCSHCKLLLRDAVQNHEGFRLCRDCCEEIRTKPDSQCADCGMTIPVGSQVYPDKAARREIGSLEVYCPHSSTGCTWTGPLSSVEEHAAHCPHKGVECSNPGCGLIMTAALLDQHLEECSYREVKCPHCHIALPFCQLAAHYEQDCQHYPQPCKHCGQPVTRKDLQEHVDTSCTLVLCKVCQKLVDRRNATEKPRVQPFTTMTEQMDNEPCVDQEGCRTKLRGYCEPQSGEERDEPTTAHQSTPSSQPSLTDTRLTRVTSEVRGLKENSVSVDQFTELEKKVQITINALRETVACQSKKIEEQACEIAKLRSQLDTNTISLVRVSDLSAKLPEMEGRQIQIIKRVEELHRANTMMKIDTTELEIRLQVYLATTHTGSFLWRIPEVARRKRDALDGEITSIYSPPFYSGRNGYKMCMRAYLNGDGIGFNTHLSVFFVLMRGEYDPLLKWPFESKVSLILVDPNLRQHIIQTFKPSPESSSFQKPRSDMNVASGCPQFAKLSVLEEGNYVKDDVMFLKCIVDTARITHP